MAWKLFWSSICVRIAPIPPGFSLVPVAASTSSAYVLSDLGYAITGSEHRVFFNVSNAAFSSSVYLPLKALSFLVRIYNGDAT